MKMMNDDKMAESAANVIALVISGLKVHSDQMPDVMSDEDKKSRLESIIVAVLGDKEDEEAAKLMEESESAGDVTFKTILDAVTAYAILNDNKTRLQIITLILTWVAHQIAMGKILEPQSKPQPEPQAETKDEPVPSEFEDFINKMGDKE